MKKIKCPECGKKVDITYSECYNCGCPIDYKYEDENKNVKSTDEIIKQKDFDYKKILMFGIPAIIIVAIITMIVLGV